MSLKCTFEIVDGFWPLDVELDSVSGTDISSAKYSISARHYTVFTLFFFLSSSLICKSASSPYLHFPQKAKGSCFPYPITLWGG